MQTHQEVSKEPNTPDPLLKLRYADILIIDDDKEIISFLTSLLGKYTNLNLIAASTEEKAMEFALRYRPDLIIIDIHMPKVLGTNLSQAIHKLHHKQSPVIFISHDVSFQKDIEYGWDPEIVEFVKKPIDITELKSIIVKLLS